ncbi:MAG: RelA/SpoT domain-containing protein [Thermoanaerobaculia bacterium]
MNSKSLVDKAGRVLTNCQEASPDELLDLEIVFDEYRKDHLKPLSELTLELQRWLAQYDSKYYIAHRLKRKPQILRKLIRLSVRLTQLQDIGGCRIIVETNADVEKLFGFLRDRVAQQTDLTILRRTDYRELGRDDSGYRALHLIVEKGGLKLELQIRSRIQHYWAENIERASVIYGHYLKEMEGDKLVLSYFKLLSDMFYEIESGRRADTQLKLRLAALRQFAEEIISASDPQHVLNSYVNEGIVKTLIEKEKSLGGAGLNNWIIVFDWNQGAFVSWDIVARDPDAAIAKYVEHERAFPAEDGFEVVLVGSSDVATVRLTHSHYFGVSVDGAVLESLDESIVGFSKRLDIDVGARQILASLHRKRYWGTKTIAVDTLRNHYCQKVLTFDSSLAALIEKGLVYPAAAGAGVALNIKRKREVEEYLR